MKTFHDDATISRTRSGEKGFTLIELLVVIAILTVLPGVLLPAIQAAREAAAHNEASANVNQLIIASQGYRNRRGSYPRRVEDLIGWNLTPLDPEVARGKKNGYLFGMVESDQDHCQIEAKPEYPGITGALNMGAVVTSNNVGSYHNVRSYQILSAGADETRERVVNNIRAKAAETVVRLLNFDNSATSQVRGYVESPDTINGVFNALDSDDDGRVSVEEILTSSSSIRDAELRSPVEEFLAYVAQEMKLDSLSEAEKREISVGIADLEFTQQQAQTLFSYDGLSLLTKAWINQPDISNSLCATLEAAEAAEENGDLESFVLMMRSYQNQVRAQIGQTITGSDAQRLITLTDVMVSRY
ncbi:MAG: prepilin-type N-terminal cleavage/methylation domain-containing protein [Pyrinomonadaceae bacterium]|nr:prepilin-type N-terminal cleavage/methylation domain-containing protein [Pyrinomonadaceae bacterium]